jgi:hypothetical protein
MPIASGQGSVHVEGMAKAWNGFLPQNQLIKEEWDLLEACELRARLADHSEPPVEPGNDGTSDPYRKAEESAG